MLWLVQCSLEEAWMTSSKGTLITDSSIYMFYWKHEEMHLLRCNQWKRCQPAVQHTTACLDTMCHVAPTALACHGDVTQVKHSWYTERAATWSAGVHQGGLLCPVVISCHLFCGRLVWE